MWRDLTGTEAARLPWSTPITLFETLQGSLHRFSFHEPGDPAAEPTNGHCLVLGKSGGGKTTTVTVTARSERWVLRYGEEYVCLTAAGGRP